MDVRLSSTAAGVGVYSGSVEVSPGNSLDVALRCGESLQLDADGAPEWVRTWILSLGRMARKSAGAEARWPRRIRQWRASPVAACAEPPE